MRSRYLQIENDLKLVEEHIQKAVKSRTHFLKDTTDRILKSGGKRLRPSLTLICAGFGEYDKVKAVPAASAIEILHTATLVHDDIIDSSKTRRGIPTVASEHGIELAVYTGDFLFTKAVMELSESIPHERLRMVASAVKSICEGEVDQFFSRFDTNISVSSYLKRVLRKTSLLFAAACMCGAYSCGCSEELSRKLGRYGMNFGAAFQIKDDLNDFILCEKASGKTVMNDINKGDITLPAIYAMRHNKRIKTLYEQLKGDLTEHESQQIAIEIKNCVCKTKGIEQASLLLRKYTQKCKDIAEKLPEHGPKEILRELPDRIFT